MNFMAIVSVLAYLETGHIHYLGGQELYGPLSNIKIIFLFLPFIVLIGHIFDTLEKVSKRNAIIVKVAGEMNALANIAADLHG